MKFLSIAAMLLALAACNKKTDDPTPAGNYVDATSKTDWHYFSLAKGAVVGSGAEADNAAWAARGDWDLAVRRFNIRTNGGAFSSNKGGVYCFDSPDEFGNIIVKTAFADVTKIPTGEPTPDKAFTAETMGGGTETIVRSEAVAVQMWRNAEGVIMKPVYKPAPVYVFRTADGTAHYKVQFTHYFNEKNESGHVRFISVKL